MALETMIPSTGAPHRLTPHNGVSRNSRLRWFSQVNARWLGACASFLCLIHCFSIPFILLIAPGIFRVVPFQFLHELELIFWIVALDLGLYSMKDASVSLGWRRAFFALAVLVPPTIYFGKPALTQSLLAAMALMQFVLVLWSHRRQSKQELECCHDH